MLQNTRGTRDVCRGQRGEDPGLALDIVSRGQQFAAGRSSHDPPRSGVVGDEVGQIRLAMTDP